MLGRKTAPRASRIKFPDARSRLDQLLHKSLRGRRVDCQNRLERMEL